MTERTCTRCGRRLAVELFSPGQGRCRRCRRELERERRASGRVDEEKEWKKHRDYLIERVLTNLARLERGRKPDYRKLDWLDRMQVELATEALHEDPTRDYYCVGLAREVAAAMRTRN